MGGQSATGSVNYQKPYYATNDYTPIHITADISGKKIGTVGNALSTRMKLTVVDEKGKKIDGFFTENVSNDMQSLFRSRFPLNASQATEKHLKEAYRRIYGYLTTIDTVEKYVGLFEDTELDEDIARSTKVGISLLVDHVKNENEELTQLLDRIAEKTGMDENELHQLFADNSSDFRSFLAGAFQELAYSSIVALTNTEGHARQAKGGNINKRNNAMYDYAALLGQPELLAKSSSMTLKEKKKTVVNNEEVTTERTIQGTFMLNAKGNRLNQLRYDAAVKGKEAAEKVIKAAGGNGKDFYPKCAKIKYSGSAVQNLSNLQVIDYLCGNIDRHLNNMFYQYESTQDGVITVTGMQGIDNDASFGEVVHRETVGKNRLISSFMSRLEDIRVIDAALAKEILSADFSKIEERLRLADLSVGEIDAARRRFTDLQTRLTQDGKIKRIDGAAQWDKMAETEDAIWELRTGYFHGSNNIFEIVYNAAEYLQEDNASIYLEKEENKNMNGPASTEVSASEINESGSLEDMFGRFAAIQNTLDENKVDHKKIGNVRRALDKVVDTLGNKLLKNESKEFLNDFERNLLVEQLRELQTAADVYTENHPGRPGEHEIKNLSALSKHFVESVRNDIIEKEKNAASFQADALARKNRIYGTASYTNADPAADAANAADAADAVKRRCRDLRQRLPSVDSAWIRSSDEFKAMITALDKVGDAKNDIDRSAALKTLSERANYYLAYKSKQGKLSDYAQKRVRYANEIAEFARQSMMPPKKQAVAPSKEQAKEQGEIQKMIQFNNKCIQFANAYAYAKNAAEGIVDRNLQGDALKKAQKDFLEKEQEVKNGIQGLENLSKEYPRDSRVQTVCYQLLTGQSNFSGGKKQGFNHSGIYIYSAIHSDIINEQNHALYPSDKNHMKIYQSIGIEPGRIDRLIQNLESTPAVQRYLAEVQGRPPVQSRSAEPRAVKAVGASGMGRK